jgi:hypothetical protein
MNAAVDLLHAGAGARRCPSSPPSMLPSLLLSRTLLGEIGSLSASLPLFHHRRPSFGKFFLLCSFSFLLLCSYAMVILLS